MPNILVRDIPEDLYRRFADVAAQDKRSVPGEVLYLIEREITQRSARVQTSRQALEELAAERGKRPCLPMTAAEFVREVRDEG